MCLEERASAREGEDKQQQWAWEREGERENGKGWNVHMSRVESKCVTSDDECGITASQPATRYHSLSVLFVADDDWHTDDVAQSLFLLLLLPWLIVVVVVVSIGLAFDQVTMILIICRKWEASFLWAWFAESSFGIVAVLGPTELWWGKNEIWHIVKYKWTTTIELRRRSSNSSRGQKEQRKFITKSGLYLFRRIHTEISGLLHFKRRRNVMQSVTLN